METEIFKFLGSREITPKAAAFLIHSMIEMTDFDGDTEMQEEFKKHILKLFDWRKGSEN